LEVFFKPYQYPVDQEKMKHFMIMLPDMPHFHPSKLKIMRYHMLIDDKKNNNRDHEKPSMAEFLLPLHTPSMVSSKM
jgi:hypothetical protein